MKAFKASIAGNLKSAPQIVVRSDEIVVANLVLPIEGEKRSDPLTWVKVQVIGLQAQWIRDGEYSAGDQVIAFGLNYRADDHEVGGNVERVHTFYTTFGSHVQILKQERTKVEDDDDGTLYVAAKPGEDPEDEDLENVPIDEIFPYGENKPAEEKAPWDKPEYDAPKKPAPKKSSKDFGLNF